ncbi:alpha-glucosidase [Hypnocyclicus thermotrophus]|uniref:Alpha-glucosidase n=1 Tax=Hypnocyclicus thermotrophus TaxID=1627895 RepID=A0AA46E102_9FUSO|nr:TIM-barrel domain-containing protein [Hypnocyclicus thermotrophus]TDT72527.1 alpha-glucosidase [Hypnocyclicus thermotrophus]
MFIKYKFLKIIIFLLVINSIITFSEEFKIIKSKEFLTVWKNVGDVRYVSSKKDFIIIYHYGKIRTKISFIDNNIVHVQISNNNKFSEKSYAVINNNKFKDFIYSKDKDYIYLSTNTLTLKISKKNFNIEIYRGEKLISKDIEIKWNGNRFYNKKLILNNSKYYGFGEKTGDLVKNGFQMKMWNNDSYDYDKNTDPLYMSIPFFIEFNKEYCNGILFDNTYQTYFDIGYTEKDKYYFGALDGELNYYFISGNNPKEVIKSYTNLTGRINLPPKWLFGYHQSRYSYYPQKKVIELAKSFRDKNIPADAIYLDIDYMDRYKSFTIDNNKFPDFKKMIDELHNMGFKVVSIIDPGIKMKSGYNVYDSGKELNVFLKNDKEELIKEKVWPGLAVFPDFTNKTVKEWWGKQYIPLINLGIDGFWNDMNEPSILNSKSNTLPLNTLHTDFNKKSFHTKIHNVYGQEMARASLEGLNSHRPNYRNFILSRSGYAGIQKYAGVWTGDNRSNFEHLALSIPMLLNLGLSGVPISGADVGGFITSPSKELFIRWMQLGIFYPYFRNHTADNTNPQEPWAFNEETTKIIKKYINLRYKLIPYIYDYIYESSKNGIPLMRALFLEYTNDEKLYTIEDEFLFGDSLLITPVIKENTFKREVYFPKGNNWINFYTNEVYQGGKTYLINAPLDIIPIFIKENAIIPMQDIVQYIDENENNSPLYINIYGDEDTNHILYLDDGISKNYLKGVFTNIEIKKQKNKISFNIKNINYIPKNKNLYIVLKNKSVKNILINNSKLNEIKNKQEKGIGFYYKNKDTIIKLKFFIKNIEIQYF